VLTTDLVRVRRREGKIHPQYLTPALRARLLPIADSLGAIITQNIGQRRGEIMDQLDSVEERPSDRIIVRGLRKLLFDRCDFGLASEGDPASLRAALWRQASAQREGLEPGASFDRESVIGETARTLSMPPEDVEAQMFSDLRENEKLLGFVPLAPEALLDRYDVALAQSVLLRATSVRIVFDRPSPGRLRQLFRHVRFHGLLHRIEACGDGRYAIEIDGPYSLFRAVQRYGIKLAVFLPAVLRCTDWRLEANILWGKARVPLKFVLDATQGLRPMNDRVTGVAPELDKFRKRFAALDSPWLVSAGDEVLKLEGEQAVCIPDLAFDHQQSGERDRKSVV
jgi:predicted nuclease of restriction endonuclease-like RecB superfamily